MLWLLGLVLQLTPRQPCLVTKLAFHEFSVAQVDRALARCLGGHGFESCRGTQIFSLSHARDMLINSFSEKQNGFRGNLNLVHANSA